MAGFLGMGRIVIIKFDMETPKIPVMLAMDTGDQFLRGDAFLLRPQHDGCAVSVVGADIMALMPAHFLKAHPDIGLDVFDQMA